MARLSGVGIDADLPNGWEGRIYRRDPGEVAGSVGMTAGATSHAILHAANFPLPVERGDYGSGAVEIMSGGDVFVVLFEHGPAGADSALFTGSGLPGRLSIDDFSLNALQRAIPGQAGKQVFFTVEGRAFCLYVVLGSYDERLVEVVNAFLRGLRVGRA